MSRRKSIALAISLGLAVCSAAVAQTEQPELARTGPEAKRESDFHTRLGVAWTSQYLFRGIQQQDGGLILQPELEIGRGGIYAGEVPLSWSLGTWNSLHEGSTGASAAGGNAAWYESQFHLGVRAGVADGLDVGMTYAALHSPNRGFRIGSATTTQELRFKAEWNDSGNYDRLAFEGLYPYAQLAFELSGGRDAGNNLGTYLELGARPMFLANDDITIALPVRAGFSLSNYYEDASGNDDFFGFLSIGAEGTMQICDASSVFGPWHVSAGLDLILLGSHTRRFNDGDRAEFVVGVDFILSF